MGLNITVKEGRNLVSRSSVQSSVTTLFQNTFHALETDKEDHTKFNLCGCGWPHHMLLPKGKVGGMECELFVMISNYEFDKVTIEISA